MYKVIHMFDFDTQDSAYEEEIEIIGTFDDLDEAREALTKGADEYFKSEFETAREIDNLEEYGFGNKVVGKIICGTFLPPAVGEIGCIDVWYIKAE